MRVRNHAGAALAIGRKPSSRNFTGTGLRARLPYLAYPTAGLEAVVADGVPAFPEVVLPPQADSLVAAAT